MAVGKIMYPDSNGADLLLNPVEKFHILLN